MAEEEASWDQSLEEWLITEAGPQGPQAAWGSGGKNSSGVFWVVLSMF